MTKSTKQTLVLELGEKGGRLEFEQPSEVLSWFDEEHGKWQWMNPIPEVSSAFRAFANLRQTVARFVQQWAPNQPGQEDAQSSIDTLKSQFESSIQTQSIWLSSSPIGAFILGLQKERHQLVAAGAYLALGGAYSPQSQQSLSFHYPRRF